MQQGSSEIEIDLTEPTIEEAVAHRPPDLRRALVIGLYEAEHENLMRWARLLAPSETAAEQLEREAFVHFYGSLHDPVLPDDATRLVRRAMFEAARTGMRRNTPQRWQNDVISPAEHATPIDVGALLVHGVHQLAARQRECMVLRHYGRLSDSQVARELGATLGSTRTHLRRATARLDGLVATLAGEGAELRHALPLAFDGYVDRPAAAPDVPKLMAMFDRHDRLKAVRRVVVAGGALLLALFLALRAGAAHDVGLRHKVRPEKQPPVVLPVRPTPNPLIAAIANTPHAHTPGVVNSATSPVVVSGAGSPSGNSTSSASGTPNGNRMPTGDQNTGAPVASPVAASQEFWAAGSENAGPSGRQQWKIFGQAPAGATITMTSKLGSSETVATSSGYSAIVEVRRAPDSAPFPLTVSCAPSCGTLSLQIFKYDLHDYAPLAANTFDETEPTLTSASTPGFVVGGFVPEGVSQVTLTSQYGVRTFSVVGSAWGGFIDFANAPHGATFHATLATNNSNLAPIDVNLTRR